MDWLRHSTQGPRIASHQPRSCRQPADPYGAVHCQIPSPKPSPGYPARSDAQPCGTIRTLVGEFGSRSQHHFPTSLGSTVVTRFAATTDALTPAGPWSPTNRGSLIHVTGTSDHSLSNHQRFSTSRVHSLSAGSSISFGLRPFARRLAKTADRIEFTLSQCVGTLLRTGRSLPVALHPGVSPRCSYVQLLALQCWPSQGLSPCCSNALSGARAQPPRLLFGAPPRRTRARGTFGSAENFTRHREPRGRGSLRPGPARPPNPTSAFGLSQNPERGRAQRRPDRGREAGSVFRRVLTRGGGPIASALVSAPSAGCETLP